MQIPADKLHHISLVVHDARASAAKLARMYGIAEWHVVGDSGHLDETVVGGSARISAMSRRRAR